MRLGFALPQVGPAAGPEALVAVAKRAEALGFNDVWVLDRVLAPLAPRTPYPGSPDGKLPEVSRRVIDPFAALTFVAARTKRVGLGTSVLNLPFYNPVLLARQLTAIDVLSRGRLRVGFGTGWSEDEYEAVGASMQQIGRRVAEAEQVLKTIWTTDPAEFHGEFFHVAASVILPKPVQQPHPKIYWAAYTPAAMRRVARTADGWMPAGLPIDGIGRMFGLLKGMAQDAGRDPRALELVVRANVAFTATPLENNRPSFAGTPDQLKADIAATRRLGASGLIFDVQFSPGIDTPAKIIERMEQLRSLAAAVIT